MDIRTDVSLKPYLTMQLGGNARTMVDLYTNDDVVAVCTMAHQQQAELFVLGGGSNTLAQDSGFAGIVARNRIPGFSVIAEDDESTTITVGAGEVLDTIVAKTVANGLSGIEALSAIPGTAGAAPVQNVGAYGQEIADTLVSLEAYDRQQERFVVLSAADCEFSYRHSIFRGREMGRYIITSITTKPFKIISPPTL